MSKISAVYCVHNGEDYLIESLKSLDNFADEIIIVDLESTDKTIEIAKKYGAKIFKHKNLGYVEPVRNFGISKATGDWILVLDPDEKLPESIKEFLKKEINSPVGGPRADFYRIPRKNIIFGNWMKYSRWWPDMNVRFFRKGNVTWNEEVHGVPITSGTGFNLPEQEKYALIHHHYDSLEEYVRRMNRYTTHQAQLKYKKGYRFTWKDLIIRPADEFLSRYFFGAGYKDGIHGLAVSVLQACSEIVLYLKIWQLDKFNNILIENTDIIKVMRDKEKDLHYWQNDMLYKATGNFLNKIKRKLKI